MDKPIKWQRCAAALPGIQPELQALRHQLWQLSCCIAGQARQALLVDPRLADPLRVERFGFKAHSQNDEGGCLQEILRRMEISRPTFVKIGAGDGLENKPQFLLAQGCRGFWSEAYAGDCLKITNQFAPYLERQQLALANRSVRPQAVNAILAHLSVPQDIDAVSIDIDGPDFYVWEAQSHASQVVVIEFNGKLPPSVALVQPDQLGGYWNGTDRFGASLLALEQLGRRKGHCQVGCEISGNNSFVVIRQDLVGELYQQPFTAENHYHSCRYELTCCGAFAIGQSATVTDWNRLAATSGDGGAS
jgi:hypothetical protein